MGETVKLRTAGAQPTVYRTGLVAALDVGSSKLSDSELDRLQELIEKARKGGKK